MDVVAIDFETASGQASSACQLAAVVVRHSQIEAEHKWLIRPPRMYFSPQNIAIHGIRPADVQSAPGMDGVWRELSQLVEGQVLLAHNARFDIGVLLASLAAHGIACPDLQFSCTRVLARAAWPGRRRYGLKPLGEWLGISFQHHDALEDARCCAQIAIAVEQQYQLSELQELERSLKITRGAVRGGAISVPRAVGSRTASGLAGQARQYSDRWGFPKESLKPGSLDPRAVLTAAAQSQPLAGKRLVLLGPLRGLTMSQTHELIVQLGGQWQTHIDATTHYVVACGTTLDQASQTVSAALANAPDEPVEAARADGIRILSERQFRALLPAGKATLS